MSGKAGKTGRATLTQVVAGEILGVFSISLLKVPKAKVDGHSPLNLSKGSADERRGRSRREARTAWVGGRRTRSRPRAACTRPQPSAFSPVSLSLSVWDGKNQRRNCLPQHVLSSDQWMLWGKLPHVCTVWHSRPEALEVHTAKCIVLNLSLLYH